MFVERWSPRAMSGEPLDEATMLRLFEAARWAPSSSNTQPWRFVYARAKTPGFETLFSFLNEGNRAWCARAGALVVVSSHPLTDGGKPNRSHSLDTGSAWMSLALQASKLGLVAHGMGGFDAEKAKRELGLPEDRRVEMMIALGHPGRVEDLSEKDRAREKPSDRKPVSAFATDLSDGLPKPADGGEGGAK